MLGHTFDGRLRVTIDGVPSSHSPPHAARLRRCHIDEIFLYTIDNEIVTSQLQEEHLLSKINDTIDEKYLLRIINRL